MSYGAPVVALSSSAIPEAGGDAACYVAPDDDAALAAAILRIAVDTAYADDLRRRGAIHAAAFTWEETATRTQPRSQERFRNRQCKTSVTVF
jgi:glycosyltransferase involved in cell wall biosynthesis